MYGCTIIIDVHKSSYPVTVALGTSTDCQLKVFFTFKKKGPLYNTLDNEVSAIASLAFYENLLIGQEIGVNVCINGCPY